MTFSPTDCQVPGWMSVPTRCLPGLAHSPLALFDCCADALSNFDVYTSLDGVTWTLRNHFPGQAGSPTVLSLGSVSGRYVRIQLAAYATAIMLAEVDVWGY